MVEFDAAGTSKLVRDLGIYAGGVGMAVAGALGLAQAIDLSFVVSALLFVAGIAAVVAVHEYLGGPV